MIQHYYYACRSTASLHQITIDLEERFGLASFSFDFHDSWEYASSAGPGSIQINITKAESDNIIETWMDKCPASVNFQINIIAESNPINILMHLEQLLDAELIQYDVIQEHV